MPTKPAIHDEQGQWLVYRHLQLGGAFYFGRDLNGDGLLGNVTLLSPSQTNTNR